MADAHFVFGVDLDGVVADYAQGFRNFVASQRGIDPESLPKRDAYDFNEWGIEPDQYERLHAEAVSKHHLLASLEAVAGAAESLWRLSDSGVWIRVITHRLYVNWGHVEAVTDTVRWLDDNEIPYRDICFLRDKPDVGADCYIDDAPSMIAALRESGNDVIVFDHSYNRDFPSPRAKTWPEVETMVMDRLLQWSGHLGVQSPMPGIDPGIERLRRSRARYKNNHQ